MSKRFETAQALALKVGELLRDVCVKTIGFDEKQDGRILSQTMINKQNI